MNLIRSHRSQRAFTLVELLVVIAIIAMLVAILMPAVTNALFAASLTQAKANGRSIYVAVFARDLQNATGPYSARRVFPESDGPWDNSTEYFTYLVTNDVLNVTWNFFAPRGIEAATGGRDQPGNFEPKNNGWAVVTDISDASPDGVPFVFTRNLAIETLNAYTDDASLEDALADAEPFRKRGMVVTFKGGSAIDLRGEGLRHYSNFNPTGAENTVFQPE